MSVALTSVFIQERTVIEGTESSIDLIASGWRTPQRVRAARVERHSAQPRSRR
jgi:hypothetical protein